MSLKQEEFKHKATEETRWGSRKFYLSVISLALITILTVIGLWMPAMAGLFPTSIGGILGILGLYYAGNITSKHIVGKYLNAKAEIREEGDKNREERESAEREEIREGEREDTKEENKQDKQNRSSMQDKKENLENIFEDVGEV